MSISRYSDIRLNSLSKTTKTPPSSIAGTLVEILTTYLPIQVPRCTATLTRSVMN